MLALRDYQQGAIDAVTSQKAQGINRALVVLPTGTGKTVVFTALARQMNVKTLILVHRDELVDQTIDKFHMLWPEATVGIVKARANQVLSQVIVASVQTLAREERRVQLPPFGLVIVDEAHHSVSPSYRQILKDVGCFNPINGPLLVGVTATPERSDKVGLQAVFQKIVFHRSLAEMIKKGYLADLVGKAIRAKFDLSRVKVVAGDYDEGELSKVINTPAFNKLVVDAFIREARDRQALVFACSVAHAKDLAEMFNKAGIKAAYVAGEPHMKLEDRRKILADFRKKQIQVVVSCALLTEGYDEPSVSAIVMARPTKSQGLYIQSVGRGTRLYPGKSDCLVLDFVGAHEQSLVTLPALFGASAKDFAQKGGSVARATNVGVPTTNKKPLMIAGTDVSHWKSETVDLFSRAAMRWLPVEEGALCLVGGEAGNILMVDGENGWWAYVVKRDEIRPLMERPLEIGYAQGVSEDYVRTTGKQILANRTASWRNNKASDSQKDKLVEWGIAHSPDITAGEASDLITVHLARYDLRRVLSRRKDA